MKTNSKSIIKNKSNSKSSSPSLNPKSHSSSSKFSDKWLFLFVFIFAWILYANTAHHDWVLDDYGVFKSNIYVTKGIDGFEDILTKTYRHGSGFYTDNLYRPLSQLAFATEWQFFPDKPGLYHLINVFYYALSMVLLLAFLKKLFQNFNSLIPFIIVLLFMAHPIHTEVVANIKSRDEIFSFLFIILTLNFSILYVDKKKFYWLPCIFFSYLLAFFSKESAITLLALTPLTLYFYSKTSFKQYFLIMLMLLIPAGIYLFTRFSVLQNYPLSQSFTVSIVDNFFYEQDLFTGWATAIKLLGKYLFLLFIPYQLVCDYSFNQLSVSTFTDPLTILSLLIHLFLVVYAIMGIRKKDPVAYGILFYIITMSIFSNLVFRIGSSFAERFLFIPSLGFLISFVFILFKILKINTLKQSSLRFKTSPLLFSALTILFLFYSGKTIARSAEWKDQYTLFGADVKKSDNSAHMRLYWGLAVRDKAYEFEELNKGETRWNVVQENNNKLIHWNLKAIEQFKKGVEIYPQYADCYEQLGLLYDRMTLFFPNNNYRDTAEYYYLQCLHYIPSKATANSNLAKIYYERGEIQKAKQYYLLSVFYDPIFSDGYYNLGSTYGALGMYDSSFYYYNKCLELDPNRSEAISFMGLNYVNLKNYESAIEMYDKAIALDKFNLYPYILKTKAFILMNQYDDALSTIQSALNVNPFNGESHLLYAQIEAYNAHYQSALDHLTLAIQYTPNYTAAYYEKFNIFKKLNQIDSANYYYNLISN